MNALARARLILALVTSFALLSATFGRADTSVPKASLAQGIASVMHKPRYAHAAWNLLVTDLGSGKTVYELSPDRLAFTGSVRKLFSGADGRMTRKAVCSY